MAAELTQWSRRSILQAAGVTLALAATGCAHPSPHAAAGYTPPPLEIDGERTLRAQAARFGLLTGFALGAGPLRESEAYRRVAAQQCSIAVSENSMKWHALRPAADRFSFTEADAFVEFCEANHIKMRGHNLCWHESLPAWLEQTATPENARSLLVEHIRTVGGRYRGRMHSWDVVNEAIHPADGRADSLRNSLWLKLIGEEYIELAFRTAREADPAALLTYNEYGIEGESAADAQKRAATLLLLRRLRQRNVPIDAVGIQSHIKARSMTSYGAGLTRFIRACRDMQMEVFVTELDVDDRNLPADLATRDAGVAETCTAYLGSVLAEPNVRAVLAWGVTDPQTWLNHHDPRTDGLPQRPLLFDGGFVAKPAFGAVRAAFAVHSGA